MSVYARTVRGRTGVHPSTKCRRCGVTAAVFSRRTPVATGIDHPEYCRTLSFYQDKQGHLCASCHKETELESLFALMDKRDASRKEVKP